MHKTYALPSSLCACPKILGLLSSQKITLLIDWHSCKQTDVDLLCEKLIWRGGAMGEVGFQTLSSPLSSLLALILTPSFPPGMLGHGVDIGHTSWCTDVLHSSVCFCNNFSRPDKNWIGRCARKVQSCECTSFPLLPSPSFPSPYAPNFASYR